MQIGGNGIAQHETRGCSVILCAVACAPVTSLMRLYVLLGAYVCRGVVEKKK